MDALHAVVLGIVEGLTEFLPVSSTGHLILASDLLRIPATEFVKTFEIVIQLGAILAVVVYYFTSFFKLEVLKRLIIAFIPTGIIGLAAYKILKTYLLGNSLVVLAALLLGGIALIVFELLREERFEPETPISDISYKNAAIIGLFQSIAIIPGISRSAATIVGGLLLGIPRKTIVEFSFLLAVPTMLAASGLDLIKTSGSFSSADMQTLAIGFIVSFIVALISIRFFLQYIRNHTFIPFGIYRIVLAIAFFFLILH